MNQNPEVFFPPEDNRINVIPEKFQIFLFMCFGIILPNLDTHTHPIFDDRVRILVKLRINLEKACCTKWGPQASSSSIQDLVRNTESQAHPELLSSSLHFNTISWRFVCTFQFEEH